MRCTLVSCEPLELNSGTDLNTGIGHGHGNRGGNEGDSEDARTALETVMRTALETASPLTFTSYLPLSMWSASPTARATPGQLPTCTKAHGGPVRRRQRISLSSAHPQPFPFCQHPGARGQSLCADSSWLAPGLCTNWDRLCALTLNIATMYVARVKTSLGYPQR